MKKIFLLVTLLVSMFLLPACWPAEVGVTTTFNLDGSGTRTFVVDIMDDLLSTEPIGNPDDPEGVEDKGAVLNDKHVDGGVIAIQAWIEENAPAFITVHEAQVDGYHRYFTFSFDFTSFEDYLDKYEQLVNLSPTTSWNDFDESELPSLTIEGFFEKTMTYTESKALLEASLDWLVDGIWNDIYNEADIAGFVTKSDIWVIANVTINVGDGQFEELRHYDPDAPDGEEHTGKVIFVESNDFEATGKAMDAMTIGLTVGGGVLLLALVGVGVFFLLKKKPL